jgi:hypothetical protein
VAAPGKPFGSARHLWRARTIDYARLGGAMSEGSERDQEDAAAATGARQGGSPRVIDGTLEDVAILRRLDTIRARCKALLTRARRGASEHFSVVDARLDDVASLVARELASGACAPGALHGRMRHFDAGGRARTAELSARICHERPEERARILVDLIVPSVLLDAGAGARWTYHDAGTVLGRSEGLAVATLRMFLAGDFSRDGVRLRADAEGLARMTVERLGRGLQVSPDNPIVGLEGRAHLLAELGAALARDPRRFGPAGRPGHLVDGLKARAERDDGRLEVEILVETLLESFSSIWPGRLCVAGHPLGDVWLHPALGEGAEGLVPLHKLTQWLALSLVEPLAVAGVEIVGKDALTPLSDYRNGGLLLDTGALALRDPESGHRLHRTDSLLIIEWRALTVALLDELAPRLRGHAAAGPSKVELEAATWLAGRRSAEARRPGATPPLSVESDGTVF